MVVGVTTGTARASRSSASATARRRSASKLQLALGYSHPVEIDPPDGISFEVESPLRLSVVGIDKELVGQVAAKHPRDPQARAVQGQGRPLRR